MNSSTGKCEQMRLLAFFFAAKYSPLFIADFFLHVKNDDKNNNLLCRLSRQGREENMMNNTGMGFNFYEMWQMPHFVKVKQGGSGDDG